MDEWTVVWWLGQVEEQISKQRSQFALHVGDAAALADSGRGGDPRQVEGRAGRLLGEVRDAEEKEQREDSSATERDARLAQKRSERRWDQAKALPAG